MEKKLFNQFLSVGYRHNYVKFAGKIGLRGIVNEEGSLETVYY